jgi:xanthine dehydrogenase accessory factor
LDDESFQEDGLICGGRMQVVIEPILDREAGQYFRCLEPLTRHGAGATEAIVFDAKASGLDAPASYLFDNQLRLAASLHAGSSAQDAPAIVRRSLRPPASRPQPWAVNGVAYLPLLPRCRLIIVGGGHVGKAVADLAAGLEFDVWVVDDRPEYASQQRFPEAQRRIAGKIADVLPDIEITPETYCLIVTRGHRYDEEALHQLAGRGAAYVGMIGSRRKTQLVFENLVRKGVRREALAEVHAPVGIDIGSQTPAEIAISIWAELIARRNLPGK